MSESIRGNIESFIQRGEDLQSQLSKIKTPQTIQDSFTRDLVGEAANLFVKNVLELPYGGKARKYSKALIRQQEQKRIADAERVIENDYNIWVQSIINSLSSVSIVKAGLTLEGNSRELVNRIQRAKEGKRLETRIRGTITALRTISSKNLISNSNIPEHISKSRRKKEKSKEIIIPPDKPFTAQRAIAGLIEKAEGYLLVMDSYVDEKTLDILHNAPDGIPIRLLTCFTGGSDKGKRFLRACRSFKTERPKFEIRKCDLHQIHDRFILTNGSGWSIGPSLKDAGKKLSIITELSKESRDKLHAFFEGVWKKSVPC